MTTDQNNPDAPFGAPVNVAKAAQAQVAQAVQQQRVERWRGKAFDVRVLNERAEPWAQAVALHLANKNALNDPDRDLPVLHFYGDEAVLRGATDADLISLRQLDVEAFADLTEHAAALRFARRDRVKARGRRIITARGRPVEPLASSVLSVPQLAALPEPEWLVGGLIPAATLSQLSGAPGCFKSFTAIGWGLALATGTPFGHRHPVPTAAPVVYVAAEGSSGMYSRIAAWAHHRGIDPATIDRFHAIPRPVQLGDDNDVADLTAVVAATGAKLVIIDTRARCTVGLEENSATDQGLAIANAERLTAETGAAVLVVHHTAIADPKRARGSSAWEGAVTSSLVQWVDPDGHAVLWCGKHKDAPDGCEHVFALETVTPPGTRESRVVTDYDPLDPASGGQGSDVASLIAVLVRDTAGPDGLTAPAIVDMAIERKICQKTATRAAIRSLTRSGDLLNVGTQARPRYAFAGSESSK